MVCIHQDHLVSMQFCEHVTVNEVMSVCCWQAMLSCAEWHASGLLVSAYAVFKTAKFIAHVLKLIHAKHHVQSGFCWSLQPLVCLDGGNVFWPETSVCWWDVGVCKTLSWWHRGTGRWWRWRWWRTRLSRWTTAGQRRNTCPACGEMAWREREIRYYVLVQKQAHIFPKEMLK